MARLSALLGGMAIAGGLGASAAAQPAPDAVYVSAQALDAQVAEMTNGLHSGPVPAGPGATVLIVHRDRDGEVELHIHQADEIIVRDGHARMRVGGVVSGQRNTAEGEYRGGTLVGGKTYDLAPGDMLWIAPNTPHQVLVERGTQLHYLSAKFEAAKK